MNTDIDEMDVAKIVERVVAIMKEPHESSGSTAEDAGLPKTAGVCVDIDAVSYTHLTLPTN